MGTINFKFDLGDKVKDVITGAEGIVVAQTIFLNGCIRYGLHAQKLNKENDIIEHWVDEPQLKKTGSLTLPGKVVAGSVGGPKPVPKRNSNPPRR